MAKIKPNIIILGAQGSGKSTQAEMLAEDFGYSWIVTGKLIREAIKKNDKNSEIINSYVKNGKLVPNDIIFKNIYEPHLRKVDPEKGIIFDGMPRNISQMKIFKQLLKKLNIDSPILLYLYVPDNIVKKRILSRKICPKCDKAYKPGDIEYKKNKCKKCNIELIARNDDVNKKALAQRLSIFHQDTKKIIDHYNQHSRLVKIDGTKSVPEVHQLISKKIKKYFK